MDGGGAAGCVALQEPVEEVGFVQSTVVGRLRVDGWMRATGRWMEGQVAQLGGNVGKSMFSWFVGGWINEQGLSGWKNRGWVKGQRRDGRLVDAANTEAWSSDDGWKSPCFHCQGSDPGRGAKIPQNRQIKGTSTSQNPLWSVCPLPGCFPICLQASWHRWSRWLCCRSHPASQAKPGCLGVTPQDTALAPVGQDCSHWPSSPPGGQLDWEKPLCHQWLLLETPRCLFFSSTD